jgi:phosphatidate cytidylyltransferase
MSGVPFPSPILLVAAVLCGALVLVGLTATYARSRPGQVALRATPAFAGATGWAWGLATAGAAGAYWLGDPAVVLVFAGVSAFALANFLARRTGGREPSLHAAFCYLALPLQYGALLAGRMDLFVAGLPLAATLALPLAAIAQGDTRELLARSAKRQWGVMVWVYCISFAPALLALDQSANAGRTAGLVVFVVLLALASQAVWSLGVRQAAALPAQWTYRRGAAWLGAAVIAALGAALAWMTPFAPIVAAAMALLIAAAGFLGCRVQDAMRGERRADEPFAHQAFQPDALAYAAPLFYFAVQAWSAWGGG